MTSDTISSLLENIDSAILGKTRAVRLSVVALLAGGHVLLEDAPGLGKTSLARALAKSLGCQFTRLQCTPDLLPSDIIGSNVYLPGTGEFEFRPGPVFTNVLLADEINRTTPRTQSALLEAMSENQVSVEGETRLLPEPFFVIATQNPFEFEGTYALPENQLDRFMVCLEVGYPDRTTERDVLTRHRTGEPVDRLEAVTDSQVILQIQEQVTAVRVDDSISDYLLAITHLSREHRELSLGVSTRGALTMYRAAQSLALVSGRDYVIPDDVKELVIPVWSHRIVCRGSFGDGQRVKAVQILNEILESTPVPV
ncbi:MAG: MoxR family ATPase [Fuerstiella sp.]|nr:MoxR family ATPase [Fuerstiella sp.]